MEIRMFGFYSKNCFFVSFAQARQSGCSKALVLLGNVFVVTAPQWLLGMCMQGGWVFLLERAFGEGEGCQGVFYFHSVCLANDLQLWANTAIVQDHICFHVRIKELMYSSSQCIDYIFHLQILL